MLRLVLLVVVVPLISCVPVADEKENRSMTYHSLTVGSEKTSTMVHKRLMQVLDSLQAAPYNTPGTAVDTFFFRSGSSDETLHRFTIPSHWDEDSIVYLPHRTLKPSTALWYRKRIMFNSKTWLHVNADDGAQVFVNSQPIQAGYEDFFFIDAQQDSVDLVIRVLNNAMSGGLRYVRFLDEEMYHIFSEEQQKTLQLQLLIEKVLALELSSELAERVLMAVSVESHLHEVEELLSVYPSFLVPPYLIAQGDGLEIRWESDRDIPSIISLNFDETRTEHVVDGEKGFFSFTLPESLPDAYRVCLGNTTCTEDITLNTSQKGSFSFSVWADSQGGWPVFREVNTVMYKEDMSFSVGVGDLVSQGSNRREWHMLLNSMYPYGAQTPCYLIAGNHDYDGYYNDLISANYDRFLGRDSARTWFSWRHANAAFIALDPNRSFPIGIKNDPEQFRWLTNTIDSELWREATWRFVFIHQPPYSQGWPGYHGDEEIRAVMDPLIQNGLVDFVVSGHTHDYEHRSRSAGDHVADLLIVGGAGGSLEPDENSDHPEMDTVVNQHHYGLFTIEGGTCSFVAKNRKGEVIDSFIRKKPV